jgi:hypothetical protein
MLAALTSDEQCNCNVSVALDRRAMQRLGWTSGKMDSSGRRVWVPKKS